MEHNTIERSIRINAPREQIWNAITDPAQFASWFLPSTLGAQMQRSEENVISMLFGPMTVEVLALEDIESPRRVTSRSLPDRVIATTYTLDEDGGGTRVAISMSGFETLSSEACQERLNLSGAAWDKALANLKAYVENTPLPYPEPDVAPLFGYWREFRDKVAVERTIWIRASRERVWRALIDPDQVRAWFSPESIFKSSGSEVGARLYIENPETGEEMYVQTLEVVDPPNRLVLRSQVEPPETSFVTDYTLRDEDGGTRVFLNYTGYEGMPQDVRHMTMEQNTFGFGMMLENLKASVEGTTLPYPGGL